MWLCVLRIIFKQAPSSIQSLIVRIWNGERPCTILSLGESMDNPMARRDIRDDSGEFGEHCIPQSQQHGPHRRINTQLPQLLLP